jgi:hypothetical protein
VLMLTFRVGCDPAGFRAGYRRLDGDAQWRRVVTQRQHELHVGLPRIRPLKCVDEMMWYLQMGLLLPASHGALHKEHGAFFDRFEARCRMRSESLHTQCTWASLQARPELWNWSRL